MERNGSNGLNLTKMNRMEWIIGHITIFFIDLFLYLFYDIKHID